VRGALEDLTLGVNAGSRRGTEGASERATRARHLCRQPALEDRRSEEAGWPSPHVHEHERGTQFTASFTAISIALLLADEPSTAATIGVVLLAGDAGVSLSSAAPADRGVRVGIARALISDLLRCLCDVWPRALSTSGSGSLKTERAADGEPRIDRLLLLRRTGQVAARQVFSLSGLGPIRVAHYPHLAAPSGNCALRGSSGSGRWSRLNAEMG
jgi:hypothetical protein